MPLLLSARKGRVQEKKVRDSAIFVAVNFQKNDAKPTTLPK